MSNATSQDEQPDEDHSEEDARLAALLEKHAAILGEQFESVTIFGVVNRGDGVYGRMSRGAGNWFSQYGAIKEWVLVSEQGTRNQAE